MKNRIAKRMESISGEGDSFSKRSGSVVMFQVISAANLVKTAGSGAGSAGGAEQPHSKTSTDESMKRFLTCNKVVMGFFIGVSQLFYK